MNKSKVGILERINSYYTKACTEYEIKNNNNKKRNTALINMFKEYHGEIDIYMFHMDDRKEAEIIEAILTRDLKPLYYSKYFI